MRSRIIRQARRNITSISSIIWRRTGRWQCPGVFEYIAQRTKFVAHTFDQWTAYEIGVTHSFICDGIKSNGDYSIPCHTHTHSHAHAVAPHVLISCDIVNAIFRRFPNEIPSRMHIHIHIISDVWIGHSFRPHSVTSMMHSMIAQREIATFCHFPEEKKKIAPFEPKPVVWISFAFIDTNAGTKSKISLERTKLAQKVHRSTATIFCAVFVFFSSFI